MGVLRRMAYAWQLLSVFNAIKENIWQSDDVIIDSMNMRMNYQATVSFLLTCSCLVTFNNWFGGEKPIECVHNQHNGLQMDFLEDFCLIHPKRISVRKENWEEKNLNLSREGDFKSLEHGCSKLGNGELVNCARDHIHDIYYYEWTAMFFIAQALCFYATRFIWKRWENGTMKYMKDAIHRKELTEDEQAKIAAEMLKERKDKNWNNVYATGYCVVELICYFNIICQWFITINFLGEIEEEWITEGYEKLNFFTLGFHVMKNINLPANSDSWLNFFTFGFHEMKNINLSANQTNPLIPLKMMFPRQSYCQFEMPGRGGGWNIYQMLCLLSLNIIHDKIFFAMWFLLMFLSFFSVFNFVKRSVLVFSQTMRRKKLQWTYLRKKSDDGPSSWTLLNRLSVTHSNYLFFDLFGQNFSKSLQEDAGETERD